MLATTPTPTDPVGVSQYILQDANYNVVAQADLAGNIVYQNTWSPYGELLAFEQIAPIPPPGTQTSARLPIGHQGLFHVPFNISTGTAPPVTSPAAHTDNGFYYNRNRWYLPNIGRFAQRDPNADGSQVLSLKHAGAIPWPSLNAFDYVAIYSDGFNRYFAFGGNPLIAADPLGLAAHHLYPLHLGGNPSGPGILLSSEEHKIFHAYLSNSLRGSTYPNQRAYWNTLPPEVRKQRLEAAAVAAGIDITDPNFQEALEEAYNAAEHGVNKSELRRTAKLSLKEVRRAPRYGPKAAVYSKIKGANKAQALKIGGSVANAALAVSTLATLNIWDPNIRELGASGIRARGSGGLTIWDEAFGLGDFYNLTQEPVSAGHAWRKWQEGLDGGF